MTKLENIANILSDSIGDLSVTKTFGYTRVELHAPFGVNKEDEICAEHLPVDLYIYHTDPDTKEVGSAVSWYAVKLFSDEECKRFEPIYFPDKRMTYNYSEDDIGEEALGELQYLMYQPDFIRFIKPLINEFIKKLQTEVAKL